MNRDLFLKPSGKTEEITLIDGTKAKIRKLSEVEVEQGHNIQKKSGELAHIRFMVAKAVLNDDGTQAFTDTDIANMQGDFEAFAPVVAAITKFSGMLDPKA